MMSSPRPSGEIKLWSQVLIQAVRDAEGGNSQQRYALSWLFGRSSTFEYVCGIWDWDPDYIRRRLALRPLMAAAIRRHEMDYLLPPPARARRTRARR